MTKVLLTILLFLFLSVPVQAAIALVQSATTYTASSPQTLAFTSNPTAGNLLVITYQDFGVSQGDPTVTDTIGNVWIKAVHVENTPGDVAEWIYYAINKTTAADTVSLTGGANTGDMGYDISEWSGVNTNLIATNSGIASSAAYATGSVRTQGPSLLITNGGNENAVISYTVGAGWTTLFETDGHSAMSQYQITNAIGTYTGTMTGSMSTPNAIVVVAFSPAPSVTIRNATITNAKIGS